MVRPLKDDGSPQVELTLESLLTQLRAEGLRLTRSRRHILRTLIQAKRPLSLEQIQERSTTSECAPDYATVFRILMLLLRLGLVRKVNLDRSCSFFELLNPQEHHDHIVCTECGKVTLMVDSCPVEKYERSIERRYGYINLRHTLEFFGRCPDCQPA